MKKAALILFAFATVTAGYYGIYHYLFNTRKDGKPLITEWQKECFPGRSQIGLTLKNFDPSVSYDVLFFGSSHTYRLFDPRIFREAGLKTYNFGSSSQTPDISLVLMEEYIKHTKRVVMEFYPPMFTIEGTESFYDMNTGCKDYGVLLKMAFRVNQARCFNMLSVKPFIDRMNDTLPLEKYDLHAGYIEKRDSAGQLEKYVSYTLDMPKAVSKLETYREIINLCKKEKKELIFIFSPIPGPMVIENEMDLVKEMNSLCFSEGVPFLNFSRAHDLDPETHFFDDDHMNSAGVAIFNKALLRNFPQYFSK